MTLSIRSLLFRTCPTVHNGLSEMFQQTNQGICFKVKVIPKASRSEVVNWENDELKIRLAAVPEKGEANRELLRYLANILGIAKSNLQLVQGETSRHKRVCVTGLTLEEMQIKIQHHIGK
jgi:uncharacterized protein (TIGR00251 family)